MGGSHEFAFEYAKDAEDEFVFFSNVAYVDSLSGFPGTQGDKFTVASTTGSTFIGSTLTVAQATIITGVTTVSSDLTVGGFTVTASDGSVAVPGTFTAQAGLTLGAASNSFTSTSDLELN